MNLPSIRECAERLAALEDSPTVAAALRQLNAEVSQGSQDWAELVDGARRIEQLHLLAQQLYWNLRNFGTPRVTPPSAKAQAMSLPVRSAPARPSVPAHLVRPASSRPKAEAPLPGAVVEQLSQKARRELQASSPPAARTQPEPFTIPAGMVTIRQIAARAAISASYVSMLLGSGVVPKPTRAGHGRRPALWTEEQAAAIVAQLGSPEGRSRRRTPEAVEADVPAGWVSAKAFAARMGYVNVDRVHYLVHSKRIPAPQHRKHRKVYLSEAVVAKAVAEFKAASAANRGTP
jgi:hypothetical protein